MKCKICSNTSLISKELKYCLSCIRLSFPKIESEIQKLHARTRSIFNLPKNPPKSKNGIGCNMCVNRCKLKEKEIGYCGTKTVINGRLHHIYGTPEKGLLDWYFDPLPTNCVAEWVCSGRDKYGLKNLAVFYRACSFNCLFCQNWHFKEPKEKTISAEELADVADDKTFCVCFFGGDPTPQLLHAFELARRLIKENIKICWETNGSMNKELAKEIAELSFISGGCVKFDLKTYDEKLSIVLCGASNENTLENFIYLAENYSKKSTDYPFLIASTLLIPYYIDENEIEKISKFIASLNPEIPYSLLAFYPNFYMYDLPTPKKDYAYRCYQIAKNNGLKRVNIGNIYLLS